MTAGVLIRRLIVDPDLEGVTHVMLDEVHERGTEVGPTCRASSTAREQPTRCLHSCSADHRSCTHSGWSCAHLSTWLTV